jgi:hypothetical protein
MLASFRKGQVKIGLLLTLLLRPICGHVKGFVCCLWSMSLLFPKGLLFLKKGDLLLERL